MKMLSNTPPPSDSTELWKHFSDTYFSLRVGLASLGFAMPFVLYLYGKFGHGLDLQPSMSAYFWAAGQDQCHLPGTHDFRGVPLRNRRFPVRVQRAYPAREHPAQRCGLLRVTGRDLPGTDFLDRSRR